MGKIELVEKDYLKKSIPEFKVGDEVKISLKVQEGDKTRIQIFEGTVIKRRGRSVNATFVVLKEVREDKIEKTFFLHSPHIKKTQVDTKEKKIRRAKLYYLRK